MNSFVYYQTYIFLAAIYGGVIIALLYDTYKVLRTYFNVHKYIRVMQDILFWLCISVVAISVLLYSNNGDLKAGSIVGFFIGAVLYKLLIGKYVIRYINWLINIVLRLISTFVRGLKRLYYWIIKMLLLPIRYTYNLLKPIGKFAKKNTNTIKAGINKKVYTPTKKKASKIKYKVSSDYEKYKKEKIAQKKKATQAKKKQKQKQNKSKNNNVNTKTKIKIIKKQ